MSFNLHIPTKIKSFRDDNRNLFVNPEQLLKIIGDTTININRNYYDSFNSTKSEIYECSLIDYFNECENNKEFKLQCTEMLLTEQLRELFPINRNEYSFVKKPYGEYFFSAFKGAIAPLHFDWDFCNVMLTQLLGRKRVVVFNPGIGKRLLPISNTSIISFNSLDVKEQQDIISKNKGLEFIIEPGDTLFIPKLWWHYVEYLDFGISINCRFGNTPIERRLLNLPRNFLLQTISHKLNILNDKNLTEEIIEKIMSNYYKPYSNGIVRYKSMRSLYKKLYNEICHDCIKGDYVGDNFDLELSVNKSNSELHYGLTFDLNEVNNIINTIPEDKILNPMKNYFGYNKMKKAELNDVEKCTIIHKLHLSKML